MSTWEARQREKAIATARANGASPNQASDYATARRVRAVEGREKLSESDRRAIARVEVQGNG